MTNDTAIRFNEYSGATGDHSYSGAETGFDLAYNGRCYRVRDGRDFGRGIITKDLGEFDSAEVESSESVDVMKLHESIQRVLGVTMSVPEGCVLVTQECEYMFASFKTYEGGDNVEPSALRKGHVLSDGESVVVDSNAQMQGFDRTRITNTLGKAVESDGSADEKREFAQQQIVNLRNLGYSESRAVRIMRAGGPGAVQPAIEWVEGALEALAKRGVRSDAAHDALDCLLSGAGGTNGFGKDRMVASIDVFDLPIPNHYNSRSLFAVIDAAKQILVAGFPDEAATMEDAA